ncbi:hypothetical protein [Hymenobacter sp. H14-R3]|uniref:hypothetical protein n=1 Tax=Hymenobacter sp. H14-R3 TaxID=3046308 RepID=UPI0024BB12E1|nr:hypothetical protein [Hymenobacter sp. H14-R3]
MAFTSDSAAPTDRLGVAGPLTFGGTTYNLAWATKPSATYYVQEYLPKGEKSADFKQMLALHLVSQDTDVRSVAALKVKELEARKQSDVICNYQLITSPDNKEIILDFLLSQNMEGNQGIAEFNVYRYKQVALGAGKTGVLLYAYSKRGYGAGIDNFLKTLKPVRTEAIAAMAAAKLPAVKITD